ncbi:tripartite tricarboxylate transporter TctB family protein [Hominifimenecus sp. rT4P-3]|uniref:tripartite tricarboxylate transporter TctB family protein n=1 Tax=Hominifimenecus sp. rT4P-3 TaxID=3242979 RepID=UPI003DA34F4B
MDKKTYQRKEYPIIFLFFLFSIIAGIESWKLFVKYPGAEKAGFYPLLLSGVMCLFCLLSFLEAVKTAKTLPKTDEKASLKKIAKEEVPVKTLLTAALVVAYILLFAFTNFYIATGVFLLVSISILGKSRGKQLFKNLLISLGSLVTVWLVMEKIFAIHLSM